MGKLVVCSAFPGLRMHGLQADRGLGKLHLAPVLPPAYVCFRCQSESGSSDPFIRVAWLECHPNMSLTVEDCLLSDDILFTLSIESSGE